MGKLLEQSIKTLYQGVSRQPDPVRLPGQVEEAENVLFSIFYPVYIFPQGPFFFPRKRRYQ